MVRTTRNKNHEVKKTTKDIFGIACELATEKYWLAREYDYGNRSREHLLAKAAEDVMCCLDTDIYERLYSREDFTKQEEIARVVADSYGLTLEDLIGN